tara:strand:- start:490 stop:894 length:405 start_codon:yes stop_codon:yes gene_type:complete
MNKKFALLLAFGIFTLLAMNVVSAYSYNYYTGYPSHEERYIVKTSPYETKIAYVSKTKGHPYDGHYGRYYGNNYNSYSRYPSYYRQYSNSYSYGYKPSYYGYNSYYNYPSYNRGVPYYYSPSNYYQGTYWNTRY